MMKKCDQSVTITHNINWSCIIDHLYRISIIGGLQSGRTSVF